ncbi:hypothetical protein Tco_0224016 [Tanacetum coccineum]
MSKASANSDVMFFFTRRHKDGDPLQDDVTFLKWKFSVLALGLVQDVYFLPSYCLLGYSAVPPPYTGNFMPPKHDLVYPSLDDFVEVNKSASESVIEKPTVETNEPKNARKENGAPIIEDWVFGSEE